MIRPITLITALLAILSGLYLYHSKNAVLMLDRRIEKIARDTMAIGNQTRLLHAEWTLLNDPERLRELSDRYLALRPLAPTQFTALADLGSRIPAPMAPEPEPQAPPTEATTEEPVPAPEAEPALIAEEDVLPLPPMMVPAPPGMPPAASSGPTAVATASPRPAPPVQQTARTEPPVARPPLQAQAADSRPVPRPTEAPGRVAAGPRPPLQGPIPVASTVATRPAQPIARPTPPAYVAQNRPPPATTRPSAFQPASVPATGSMLGGAQRGAPVPLPRPTPYFAPAYDGGG